jgi:hypothetical protein
VVQLLPVGVGVGVAVAVAVGVGVVVAAGWIVRLPVSSERTGCRLSDPGAGAAGSALITGSALVASCALDEAARADAAECVANTGEANAHRPSVASDATTVGSARSLMFTPCRTRMRN